MIDAEVELVFFTGRLARREEVVLVRVLIRRRSVWRWEEFQKITRDGIEALSRNTVTGEGSRAYTARRIASRFAERRQRIVQRDELAASVPQIGESPASTLQWERCPARSGALVRVLCSAKKKNVRFLPS